MTLNFLALSTAEVLCRATSVAVTIYLTHCLGRAGFGRIEFAFNVVFWLVLLVRDGCEVFVAREIARHPRLVRPLVNYVLAIKVLLAGCLLLMLVTVGLLTLSEPTERMILALYGLLLLTTALGLDFVYRGLERMGLVAVSLLVRTAIYALGVWFWVADPSQIVWVPVWLVTGEVCGIALVWVCYTRRYGLPRPALGRRFLGVFLRRGRPIYAIQVAQAAIGSIDLLVVGLMSRWADVGLYSAPHRMVTAVLTFGLIVQQVVFPTLARSWRGTAAAGRQALDAWVRVVVSCLVPLVVGTVVLSRPLVRHILTTDYSDASLLLALGIARAPLLTIAYLYQTALIALNRETSGVRLMMAGALTSGPLVALLRWRFGLPGAEAAGVLIGFALVAAGHWLLACEGRQPVWHHHLARPLLASLAMVPVCLPLASRHLGLAVAGGVIAYALALVAIGGVRLRELRSLLGGRARG
jgi:O-antigen/teichoic acid export membrane protein